MTMQYRKIALKRVLLKGLVLTWLAVGVLLPGPWTASAMGAETSQGPALNKSPAQGMFALYERNRREGVPNYITEDFILLAQSMVLNQALTELEEQVIRPKFQELVAALLNRLEKVDKPTGATKANQDFLKVAQTLLTGEILNGTEAAQKELELILAAEGIALSPLLAQRIDYSQFRVRGKYTATKELGQYFRVMKYAGTVLFPVLESKATSISKDAADRLTSQALELSRLISGNKEIVKLYQELDRSLTLLFGPSEELTCWDYVRTAEQVGDDIPKLRATLLTLAREDNRQPRIISLVVDKDQLEKGVGVRDVATGWRLLPQRYTPDAAVFQTLVFDQVRDFEGRGEPFSLVALNGGKVKGLPLGLEIMALLGSEEAGRILRDRQETNYKGYKEASAQARSLMFKAKANDLASSNLGLMNYWLTRGEKSRKDPIRRLNSCLGLWTYQRYISILYAKQSYTIGFKSLRIDKPRQGAWIAPAPELYLYLKNQLSRLNRVFESDRLEGMMTTLDRCQEIAAAELAGFSPDKEDAEFLNNLDKDLKALTGAEDRPIVVDVHTEPTNGLVVEEALGLPRVVEKNLSGKTSARGTLFSYYEFKWPLEDRLTDEAWRALLTDPEKMGKLKLSPGSLIMEKRK